MAAEQNDFLINISILYRNTQKYFDKVMAQFDIGSGQLLFLLLINESEGITMQEITKISEVDKGTTTKSIQKLIEQGYVLAQVDENDRRVRRLYTTSKAIEIMTPLYEYRNELRKRLSHDVDIEEFEKALDQVCMNSRTYLVPKPRYESIRIGGLQKVTLLDYPNYMASTIFTSGCNFKCPYCHNKDLVFIPEDYQFFDPEEVIAYLESREGIIDGVCISGGEPLMQEGLEEYIKDIKDLGYLVKLDTNGYYPERLKALLDTGMIDMVAMDVKNSKEKYARTVGINEENFDISKIEESIKILLESPVETEFRTTVIKEFHEKEDLIEIAKWIQGCDHYYLQQYVESENVIHPGWTPYNKEEMEKLRQVVSMYLDQVELRGVREG